METRDYLLSILKEMGTDVSHLSYKEWEVFDEIIRRIHLHISEKKRLLTELKRMRNALDGARQFQLDYYTDKQRRAVLDALSEYDRNHNKRRTKDECIPKEREKSNGVQS